MSHSKLPSLKSVVFSLLSFCCVENSSSLLSLNFVVFAERTPGPIDAPAETSNSESVTVSDLLRASNVRWA